jgi:predicted lactoylglutathione lyase
VRSIFVNLPVTDLARARTFYTGLGFSVNEEFSDDRAAAVVVDEHITVMLLTRDRFAEFVDGPVGDPAQAVCVLHALSVDSREEADELLTRALATGGKPFRPAQDHGFMYGTSFTDPDGNVWETVWMDASATP